MALNTRGSVDGRWLTHFRGVLSALQLANIQIYNPGTSGQLYDSELNSWTSNNTQIYSGRARVQPVNSVSEVNDNYNPTFIKTVRIQVSARNLDVRPNDRIKVTSAPYNTTLTKFMYVVTDVLNSSNPWELTLLCRVDTELDPTSTGD